MENYKDGDKKESYTFIQANTADHVENTNGKKENSLDSMVSEFVEKCESEEIESSLLILDEMGNALVDSKSVIESISLKEKLKIIIFDMLNSENITIKNMSMWFLTRILKYCYDIYESTLFDEEKLGQLIDSYLHEEDTNSLIYIVPLIEQIALRNDEAIPVLIDSMINEKTSKILSINSVEVQEAQNMIASLIYSLSCTHSNLEGKEGFVMFLIDLIRSSGNEMSGMALELLISALNKLNEKFSCWTEIILGEKFEETCWLLLNENRSFTYPLLDTLKFILYSNPEAVIIHNDIIYNFLNIDGRSSNDIANNPQYLALFFTQGDRIKQTRKRTSQRTKVY